MTFSAGILCLASTIWFTIGLGLAWGVSYSSCPKPVQSPGHATVTYRLVDGRWRCDQVEGDVAAVRRAARECQP
jgi:hypothetical protein